MVKTIPIITSGMRRFKPVRVKEYKHFEVPWLWYSLPSSLLSNATSLSNKFDEVPMTVRSTCADRVVIMEAWQIVPKVCNTTTINYFTISRLAEGEGEWHSTVMLSPPHLQGDIPKGVEVL